MREKKREKREEPPLRPGDQLHLTAIPPRLGSMNPAPGPVADTRDNTPSHCPSWKRQKINKCQVVTSAMEYNKASEKLAGKNVILCRNINKGLPEKVIYKERPKGK